MKTRILNMILAVLLISLLTTITVSAGSPVIHRVSVGSPDYCFAIGLSPGCDKSFSLVAMEYTDGSVTGQWTDHFGGGFGGFHARIDCLVVDGKDAWISGVITQGEFNFLDTGESVDLTGQPISTRVRDNGVTANDPADQISFSHFVGFGYQVCTEKPDHELLDVPQGQVLVD